MAARLRPDNASSSGSSAQSRDTSPLPERRENSELLALKHENGMELDSLDVYVYFTCLAESLKVRLEHKTQKLHEVLGDVRNSMIGSNGSELLEAHVCLLGLNFSVISKLTVS